MILQRFKSFVSDYKNLPKEIQARVDEALVLFEQNPWHPSLRIKKMKATKDVWEGRVTRSYRFTFEWEGDVITFRRVGTHDILKEETR
ncbi:MAG: hypothetical protein M1453_06050 [Acidobacteria bacterium]|nr:hypothetical protein [Acidobacteriota bacterium]MCL5287541.1 hypothetical protein [Acidobacteriota bacterium]